MTMRAMRTVCFSRQATRVSPFVFFDEASSPSPLSVSFTGAMEATSSLVR